VAFAHLVIKGRLGSARSEGLAKNWFHGRKHVKVLIE
jgi:hypothetical protein